MNDEINKIILGLSLPCIFALICWGFGKLRKNKIMKEIDDWSGEEIERREG